MTGIPETARWIRVTALGWLLGIPLVALFALAAEGIGVGGAQLFVGLGVGAGVGLLQGRALRPLLGGWGAWTLASTVGMALPFLAYDLAKFLAVALPYSLQLLVAIGGLSVGAWQAQLLRRRFERTGLWVVASVVGWSFAGFSALISDFAPAGGQVRGIAGALLFLLGVAVGGPILGAITAAAWPQLKAREE
jgi:hypothetical protein